MCFCKRVKRRGQGVCRGHGVMSCRSHGFGVFASLGLAEFVLRAI